MKKLLLSLLCILFILIIIRCIQCAFKDNHTRSVATSSNSDIIDDIEGFYLQRQPDGGEFVLMEYGSVSNAKCDEITDINKGNNVFKGDANLGTTDLYTWNDDFSPNTDPVTLRCTYDTHNGTQFSVNEDKEFSKSPKMSPPNLVVFGDTSNEKWVRRVANPKATSSVLNEDVQPGPQPPIEYACISENPEEDGQLNRSRPVTRDKYKDFTENLVEQSKPKCCIGINCMNLQNGKRCEHGTYDGVTCMAKVEIPDFETDTATGNAQKECKLDQVTGTGESKLNCKINRRCTRDDCNKHGNPAQDTDDSGKPVRIPDCKCQCDKVPYTKEPNCTKLQSANGKLRIEWKHKTYSNGPYGTLLPHNHTDYPKCHVGAQDLLVCKPGNTADEFTLYSDGNKRYLYSHKKNKWCGGDHYVKCNQNDPQTFTAVGSKFKNTNGAYWKYFHNEGSWDDKLIKTAGAREIADGWKIE